MKKRIISLCLTIGLVCVSIVSSVTVNAEKKLNQTSIKQNVSSEYDEKDNNGEIDESDLRVVIDECTVFPGNNMKECADKMRKPDDVTQSKVCIGSGMERVYTYGDIVISALEEKKAEKVYMIEISGSGKLPSGVGIGSTTDEIIKAYGEDYIQDFDLYTYEVGNSELNFYLIDGIVDMIEIRSEE